MAATNDRPETATSLLEERQGHEEPEAASDQAERTEKAEAEPQYSEGLPLAFICLGLFLAILCIGLDRSIVGVAVPRITSEFDSLADVGWYASAYTLTTCCFQLLVGKLYKLLSTKYVFLGSLLIFEVGSIVCAAAPNSTALIIGRAVAGVGGAGILAGALTIIALSLPLHKRPKYTGALASAMGIAAVISPLLGGVFTDKLTWRWCFWINLPLGGVTLFTIYFFLKLPEENKPDEPFSIKLLASKLDLIGTVIIMPCIIALLLALQWGGATYPWSNWRVILCLCVFGVLAVIWTYRQYLLGDEATVPFRIITQRSVAASVFLGVTGATNLFIVSYYVPTWFQAIKNTSAEQAGIDFLANAASLTIFSISSGFLTSHIGYYVPQMLIGSAIGSIGMGFIYTFNVSTSTGFWVGFLIMIGVGSGISGQTPIMAIQTVLSKKDISIGTSLFIFMQTLSSTIFLSVGSNVLQTTLISNLEVLVPEVDPAVVVANGAANLTDAMTAIYPQYVDGILEAYNRGLQRIFLIGLILVCISILGGLTMEWKSVRKDKGKEAKSPESGDQDAAIAMEPTGVVAAPASEIKAGE